MDENRQGRNDQEVVNQGRKNQLKDVDVPLRERSLQKLVSKLEKMGEGRRTVEIWLAETANRQAHLNKQVALLKEFEEFIEPIYSKSQDWQSDLHYPVILSACKTFHARFLAALLSTDPPFSVKARQAAWEDRVPVIQDVLRYSLFSWMNYYKGVEEALDTFIWRWVTTGRGILKQRWERKYERFVDVVEKPVVVGMRDTVDPQTGEPITMPMVEMQEVEEDVVESTFDGPIVECIAEEDLVIVGGDGDPDQADDVIESSYLTASDLWSYADQKIFRNDVVSEVIKSGESYISGEQQNQIKLERQMSSGMNSPDKEYDLKRYQILERYCSLDVDGSGINTGIVLWVHKETGKVLRATYLRRVSKSGMRPYTTVEFHRKTQKQYPVGLPEMLYSLSKELDALRNIRMDIALTTSMPMGFYRPGSSMQAETLEYGPGTLVPLDSPQTDIYFPNLSGRGMSLIQEESALMNQIERLTSISDITMGLTSSQGAARTATGARVLQQEANANLDVFLRRLNRGWRRFMHYLLHQLQDKLPSGFEFRVFGDDGKSFFRRVESKQELCGTFDIELDSNSANSNKAVQIEVANMLNMVTGNMLDVQLGIITPIQRFEALKNLLQANGVRDYGKYLQKPAQAPRIFTPLEIANRILAGQDVVLGPEQDLQGFVSWFERILSEDELLGQFNEQQTTVLYKKVQEAQAMMQAIAQQQAQMANQKQIAMNAAMSTGAAAPQPMQATPANPAAGE
jgi:hypothetical protein